MKNITEKDITIREIPDTDGIPFEVIQDPGYISVGFDPDFDIEEYTGLRTGHYYSHADGCAEYFVSEHRVEIGFWVVYECEMHRITKGFDYTPTAGETEVFIRKIDEYIKNLTGYSCQELIKQPAQA